MAASEQTELHAWILANCSGATAKSAGAYISMAPGDLVGKYAIGDVVRTRKLFDLLHARIVQDGMEQAYDRERRLFPIVYRGTQRGIRIDRDTLSHHEYVYTQCLSIAEGRLVDALGGNPDVLERDSLLCDALDKIGAVKEWTLTATGKRSMAKGNLKISDPKIKMLMDYRGALSTCLQTFMRPWLEFSKADGRLHPNWNQVKQYREGGNIYDKKGTQTGRLSSDSPNFQNVPAEFTYKDGTKLAVPNGLHPLPTMRSYCLPELGHVWLKRDFSSQEIRILAHFEDGSLCEAYRANVDLDPHQMAMEIIHQMIGRLYARKSVKITGFSIIYGTGANGLSIQLECPYIEAKTLKDAYLDAMPGVRDLMQDVQRRGRNGQPVRTWGGRIYYAEPPKIMDGQLRDFAYKLLNYLIQGSAADQTKQSLIDWDDNRGERDIFLATVHDEINISAPKGLHKVSMTILKNAMELDRFDVPFASEGFVGENWFDLEEMT
jgi:DNA polymerase-1